MVATCLKTAPGPTPSANGAPKLDIAAIVAGVIEDVRKEGDAAVRRYSGKFDKWTLDLFKLSVGGSLSWSTKQGAVAFGS